MAVDTPADGGAEWTPALEEGKPDGCVVETAPLSRILAAFVSAWEAGRVPYATARGGRPRAVRWLAEETRRMDPRDRGLPVGTIEQVVSARYQTTELRVADALVAAIRQPEVFQNGTLTIRGNPRAPKSLRKACCGGSERS